ncbi:MAG TPA: hypothetical protein VHL05_14740 [Terriglobales bacterium]|jgi:hypothetical protein|nr:hypothetical protein [Terriglobales bacterium]
MDINNIKRPGGFGPLSESPTDTPVDAKRESSFADATARVRETGAENSLGVISQFSKSALEDPDKLEEMMRACVTELIESQPNLASSLGTADKKTITEFLSADPMVRRELESYLRKVLV